MEVSRGTVVILEPGRGQILSSRKSTYLTSGGWLSSWIPQDLGKRLINQKAINQVRKLTTKDAKEGRQI